MAQVDRLRIRISLYLCFVFYFLVSVGNAQVAQSNNANVGAVQNAGNIVQTKLYPVGDGSMRGGDSALNSGKQNQEGVPNRTNKLRLSEDESCAKDIKKYCRGPKFDNFAILECLQNNLGKDDELSDECQHTLWSYKKKLSKDLKFESAAGSLCKQDLDKIEDCKEEERGNGLVIPCLIEYMDNITVRQCQEFLEKMESIVFSDYRLVYKFISACDQDISTFNCGRIPDDDTPQKSIHDQGQTISCLSKETAKLQPACRKQIFRVAELQSNDYHNDRQLFFACRDDREVICPVIRAGDGRVYNCLISHKFDQRMSTECRDKLTVRQKLQRQDVKVNRGFYAACRMNIINEKCMQSNAGFKEATLSAVLLCLENSMRNGRLIQPECISELKAVRKSLMEDYQITPDIVTKCNTEIRDMCNNGLQREGKTIHCLMSHAKRRVNTSPNIQTTQQIGQDCLKALEGLIKETDVRENVDVDPVLSDACRSVVQIKCADIRSGKGKVIDCLMNFVDDEKIMTEDCKTRLMETQYFVSRDFTLFPSFYKACAQTDLSVCNVESGQRIEVKKQSEVLLCLYRKGEQNQVSKPCSFAVKRVMLDRAKSVDLEPAVEDACMEDLAQSCSDKTDKNEEMDCLEDHLDDLTPECKKVVEKYVEEEDELPEINEIFRKSCQPFWKNCQEASSNNKDPGADSLMKCLIEHKSDNDMPEKCRIGIEHHQLITLKDYRLSRDFKEACKDEVQDHCKNIKTKAHVVNCLIGLVRNDTLLDQEQKISMPCRKQLKFELLQRSGNVKLDQELREVCVNDIAKLCPNVIPGKSAVINCLRSNQPKLQKECHQFIFKREQQEAQDPTTDFSLMSKCKTMIKKYCMDYVNNPLGLFSCLRKNKNEDDFDKSCFQVIIKRQRIRAHDVRLNPTLMKECKLDIAKFCNVEFAEAKSSLTETEGKVLGCLRTQFAKQPKLRQDQRLSESCAEHLSDLIKESALDYVQDVALAKACATEIKSNCAGAALNDRDDPDKGAVEECLKNLMFKSATKEKKLESPCWKEVVRVLSEDKADIHVDPLLYRACSVDLLHACKGVVKGDGRQMSCLIDSLDDKSVSLRPECRKALNDRVHLWEKAVQLAPPESFAELIDQVSSSSSRNYLTGILFAIIASIFIGGLFCGRITKRVARQIKNR